MTLANPHLPHKVICITGPTAAGKTALAISVARKLGAEIISCDSRQFYQGMTIGTAKPSADELGAVKHHFIDILTPDKEYSAGRFADDANEVIHSLSAKYRYTIVTGGSGLYLNALCFGFDALPTNRALRAELNEKYRNLSIEFLREELLRIDPDFYGEIDLHNPHRLLRAIEICSLTGKSNTEVRSAHQLTRPYAILRFAIQMDRAMLYERINQRVDKMIEEGLVEEVKNLLEFESCNALQTVGYREIFDYLNGNCSLEEAIDQIKQNTRRYAKRQMTWFRREQDLIWIESDGADEILRRL